MWLHRIVLLDDGFTNPFRIYQIILIFKLQYSISDKGFQNPLRVHNCKVYCPRERIQGSPGVTSGSFIPPTVARQLFCEGMGNCNSKISVSVTVFDTIRINYLLKRSVRQGNFRRIITTLPQISTDNNSAIIQVSHDKRHRLVHNFAYFNEFQAH